MNIRYIMLWDENHKEIGEFSHNIFRANLIRISGNLGRENIVVFSPYDNARPVSWHKIRALQSEISWNCSWVIWMDSDTILVNPNFDIQKYLATLPKEIDCFFSSDDAGLCAGVMGFRPNFWSNWFLKTIWDLGSANRSPNRWEQDTIKVIYENFSDIRKHVHLIPQEIIQNPESKFSKDAWLMHFWTGNRDKTKLLSLMKKASENWTPEIHELSNYRHVIPDLKLAIKEDILRYLKPGPVESALVIAEVTGRFKTDEDLVKKIIWEMTAAGDIQFKQGFKTLSL
jgi:hypothetical protein